MPDMTAPLAHLADLVETLRYQKLEFRRKAADLASRAEVYEEAEWKAEKVLRDERAKLVTEGKSEVQK